MCDKHNFEYGTDAPTLTPKTLKAFYLTAVERLIFICNNIFLRKRKDLRSARTRTSGLFLYKTASGNLGL